MFSGIGSQIMKDGEPFGLPCASPAAARKKALKLLKKAKKDGKPPAPPATRLLAELPWVDPLTIRPTVKMHAVWRDTQATLLALQGTAGPGLVGRVDFESKWEREDGKPFGSDGSGTVVSTDRLEAVRSDKPCIGPDGTEHQGSTYSIRPTGEVLSIADFGVRYEVVGKTKEKK